MERCFSGPKAKANEIQKYKRAHCAVFAYWQEKMPCNENNFLSSECYRRLKGKKSRRNIYFL